MSGKKLAIGAAPCGDYVFAIYSEAGFHHYETTPSTRYGEKRIRAVAREHKVEIPKRMNWNGIPAGNVIEKFDGVSLAKVSLSLSR